MTRTVLNETAVLRSFLTLTLISIVTSSVLEIHAEKLNTNTDAESSDFSNSHKFSAALGVPASLQNNSHLSSVCRKSSEGLCAVWRCSIKGDDFVIIYIFIFRKMLQLLLYSNI